MRTLTLSLQLRPVIGILLEKAAIEIRWWPSLIRILTVDDHPVLRKGIAALANAELDMKLVAEASDGQEAIEKVPLAPSGRDSDGSPDAWRDREGHQAGPGLAEFVEKWRASVAVNLKGSTTRAAESQLRAHIIPNLGSSDPTGINTKTVQGFVAYLADGGITRTVHAAYTCFIVDSSVCGCE